MTEGAAPLRLHAATVRPEWVDYNGHMSEAYYVLIFGHATDAFLDHIGMDQAVRERTATSVYTVEAHINYLREVKAGERVAVETQVLKHDAKRVHLHHRMLREGGDDPAPVATTELMLLHVDKTALRACPFRPEPLARVAAIAADHARLPRPEHIGRVIGIP